MVWSGVASACAAATPWGGWHLARGDLKSHENLLTRLCSRRELQEASRDARIHFSAPC